MKQVGSSNLDLGILTHPREIPANVVVTHRMADQFSIVMSSAEGDVGPFDSLSRFRKWGDSQNWLLPPSKSRSRQLIDDWAVARKVELHPVMELGSFDLMIQFVSMGMGVAFIPRRCLSNFPRKRLVKMIHLPVELSRQLVVISPKLSKCPEQVARFVESILFS